MRRLLFVFLLVCSIALASTSGLRQVESLIAGLHDANGDPLSGGKVYFYVAGTSTLATIYQDADGAAVQTNPVTLDSFGRAKVFCNVYIDMKALDAEGTTVFDDFRKLSYSSAFSAYREKFTTADDGLGGQLEFTLSQSFSTDAEVTMFINGVLTSSGTYAFDGTILTLTERIPASWSVEIFVRQ